MNITRRSILVTASAAGVTIAGCTEAQDGGTGTGVDDTVGYGNTTDAAGAGSTSADDAGSTSVTDAEAPSTLGDEDSGDSHPPVNYGSGYGQDPYGHPP